MTAIELRECLDALHWSHRELARTLEINLSTVQDWAAGKWPVPPRIAAWLRASAAALRAQPLPKDW